MGNRGIVQFMCYGTIRASIIANPHNESEDEVNSFDAPSTGMWGLARVKTCKIYTTMTIINSFQILVTIPTIVLISV